MKFDRVDKVLRATVLLLALSAPSAGLAKLTIEITGGAGSGIPIPARNSIKIDSVRGSVVSWRPMKKLLCDSVSILRQPLRADRLLETPPC